MLDVGHPGEYGRGPSPVMSPSGHGPPPSRSPQPMSNRIPQPGRGHPNLTVVIPNSRGEMPPTSDHMVRISTVTETLNGSIAAAYSVSLFLCGCYYLSSWRKFIYTMMTQLFLINWVFYSIFMSFPMLQLHIVSEYIPTSAQYNRRSASAIYDLALLEFTLGTPLVKYTSSPLILYGLCDGKPDIDSCYSICVYRLLLTYQLVIGNHIRTNRSLISNNQVPAAMTHRRYQAPNSVILCYKSVWF